jgi:hypothetical protein
MAPAHIVTRKDSLAMIPMVHGCELILMLITNQMAALLPKAAR